MFLSLFVSPVPVLTEALDYNKINYSSLVFCLSPLTISSPSALLSMSYNSFEVDFYESPRYHNCFY